MGPSRRSNSQLHKYSRPPRDRVPHRFQGKRPRDQLYELELEKARFEVECQRKTIPWLAWEEERQRKAIAFEEDLHRQRLAQLTNPQGKGRRPTRTTMMMMRNFLLCSLLYDRKRESSTQRTYISFVGKLDPLQKFNDPTCPPSITASC
jgi:hypothetical protein